MLGSTNEKTSGTKDLRSSLAAGERLEVAGYELVHELTEAIEDLRVVKLMVSKIPVYWFEIVSEPGRSMLPAGAKVVREWEKKNGNLSVHFVSCAPFWATQEISECPELVSAIAKILSK